MRNAVYLAGKMEVCTDNEMKGWREYATSCFECSGIPVLDPTRRNRLHDQFDDANVRNRIVQQDLLDISNSKVLLVNLSDSIPGKGWGTVAEVALAHRDGHVIITLLDEGHFKHPFIYKFSTEIHTDIDDAIDAAISYFN